jgi:spore maturation protein CgeB
MKVVLFYHSLSSCWNNGHAHFMRGIARELIRVGHRVDAFEPENGWSRLNALKDGGTALLEEANALVPGLRIHKYHEDRLDLERATHGANLVLVHEWNSASLVAALGRQRAAGAQYLLLFHDSHHRSVTAPAELDRFDLNGYDGVLAFGEVIRQAYLKRGWARRAFTLHEGADTALFHPLPSQSKPIDLIWIGNWGDEERSRELRTYLINPASQLGLRTQIHGVRYPNAIQDELAALGIGYAGWLANHRAPQVYARARVTVHVPRRPYCVALPGIPTIRVFEALACGIPLVCSPWTDDESLFPEGAYLTAADETAMRTALSNILADRELAQSLIRSGLAAIRSRHSCMHRARELVAIAASIAGHDFEQDQGFHQGQDFQHDRSASSSLTEVRP